ICRVLHRYHEKAFDRIIGRLAATRSRHITRLEHAADLAMQAFTAAEKPAASFLNEYRAALAAVREILGIPNQRASEGPAATADPWVVEALQRIAALDCAGLMASWNRRNPPTRTTIRGRRSAGRGPSQRRPGAWRGSLTPPGRPGAIPGSFSVPGQG